MPTSQPAVQSTDQLDSKQLLKVLMAVKKGDFSLRMPIEYTGVAGKIADTLNDIIDLNQRVTDELARISTVVGDGTAPALDQEQFDCVVLDLMPPDMSGLEVIERIRREGTLADLPIIVYTGKELTRAAGRQAYADRRRQCAKYLRAHQRA